MKSKKERQFAAGLVLVLVLMLLSGVTACAKETEKIQNIKPTIIPAASPTLSILSSSTQSSASDTMGVENEKSVQENEASAAVVPSTKTPVLTAKLTPTCTPSPTPSQALTWRGTYGEVSFSEAGYFFGEDLLLELTIEVRKEGYITYTMDGSEPLAEGTRYEAPLLLEGTENSSPNVYTIRAKAWYTDGTISDTYVHTYFVGTQVKERYSTIVFSINGDPAELTEEPDGILYGENYEQRGRESERKVSIEVVTADGNLLFSQYAGVRVFGGTSREHAIKSLKLYARKEYQQDKGTFELSVFGSTNAAGTKLIKKYDKLVLRNGGDDFQRGFLRDELAQRLAKKAGFAVSEAVVPAVAYVNGEYYGFYWLHESYCDEYFQKRNGDSAGEYIVLEGSDRYKSLKDDEVEYKAANEYNTMYAKFSKADLTDDAVYAQVCDWIDVENYLDYMAFNLYISNYDWPNGNYRCFRYYAAEGEEYEEGEKDGRWRFLMHDADVGFATYTSTAEGAAKRNDIAQVTKPSHERYSALLTGLLKREDCKAYFINKMLEYRDGALSYESVCETLNAMCAERDTELTYYLEHLDELEKSGASFWVTASSIEKNLERIKEFAKIRGAYITEDLEDYFGIEVE